MPPRTGQDYLQGLRQRPREIWIGGERVADVTTSPAFANCAHTLAQLYDMQHAPATRDTLTYVSPDTGQREGTSFIIPRSLTDLERRRQMVKAWADVTCGMMGRTPDFLNVNLMAFAIRADYFAGNDPRFGDNIVRYYQAAGAPARERIQLFRLAWDMVGNAFGSRQLLYERYFSGDPVRLTAGRYLSYDKAPLMERVRAFLRQSAAPGYLPPPVGQG